MSTLLKILKQVWGAVISLDRLKPSIPLKGRIRASLVWDFRGER
jgi:hypothetical protein